MLLEIFRKYIAIILLGIVIKLLDDEVDGDGKSDFFIFKELEKYKFPYGILFMSVAMMLHKEWVFSLFSSAYILGMFHFPHRKLPLKLKAYQEILFIVFINMVMVPFTIFYCGFILIFIIQLWDDLQDSQYDLVYGFFNYANYFGKGEVAIFLLILFVGAVIALPIDTFIVLSAAKLINYLYSKG